MVDLSWEVFNHGFLYVWFRLGVLSHVHWMYPSGCTILCTLCVPSNVQKVCNYVCQQPRVIIMSDTHTHVMCSICFLHRVCYCMNRVYDLFIRCTLGVSSHEHCVLVYLYTGCIMLHILTKSDHIPLTKCSSTEPCLHLFNKVFTLVH